jgi:hypothetical protein
MLAAPELGLILAGTWSPVLPRRLARRGFGRPFRIADLLGGDLVVRPCCRLARQGHGVLG